MFYTSNSPIYRTIVYDKPASDFLDECARIHVNFEEQWRAVEDILCRLSDFEEKNRDISQRESSRLDFERAYIHPFGQAVLTVSVSLVEIVIHSISIAKDQSSEFQDNSADKPLSLDQALRDA